MSKTYWNTSALKPSAAPNDSTTVPISSSGATIARNSTTRMRNTITSTSGITILLSCRFASWTSQLTAALPPTRASASGIAWTASRTRSTVA